jgi:DNA-binding transcriptional regulator YiaG
MTDFYKLVLRCGLSLQGAASLLGVSYDSVRSWKSGRRNPPAGVTSDLTELSKAIETIFNKKEN